MDDLDLSKHEVLEENTAQAVFKNIKRLENERDRFRTRWAWELLQNARDSAKSEGVKISFDYHEQQLIFRHSGESFTNKNIAHLIYHGSSKGDEDDPVGHFGTGFISTHLIAKKVQVRGVLDSKQFFDFELDRTGNSASDLHISMEKSWAAFKQSLKLNNKSVEDSYSTEFVYQLENDIAKDMVKEGLAELQNNSGFILAFNNALKELQLNAMDKFRVFKKRGTNAKNNQFIYTTIEESDSAGTVLNVVEVGSTSGSEVTAAILLKKGKNFETEITMGITPRLYVAFPLLGTEKFPLPCVFNSLKFEPTEDRDGIFLAGSESEDNTRNRLLIEKGLEQVSGLISIAESEKWVNSYQLADLKVDLSANWLDEAWYMNLLKTKLLPIVRNSKILPTLSGNRISPSDSWIPQGCTGVSHLQIWNLANQLIDGKNRLPIENEVDLWASNLNGWLNLFEFNLGNFDETFNIKKLCQFVDKLSDIDQLKKELEESVDVFNWLREFYDLLFSSNKKDLFDDLALLPDQTGKFRQRRQLNIDLKSNSSSDEIDPVLKDISNKLGTPVRKRLLHRSVSQYKPKELLQPFYQDELVSGLVESVRNINYQNEILDVIKEVNVELFIWALKNNTFKIVDGYPLITSKEKNGVLSSQILSLSTDKKKDQLLAPVAYWPDVTQEYVDLFPKSLIISNSYFELCSEAKYWNHLAERGYILPGPVYWTNEKIKDFLPDEPYSEDEDEETRRSSESVKVSKIAFLTTEDIGILNTVRNSKLKALKFLDFLINAVLKIDESALEIDQVKCENSQLHQYYKASWLTPIKRRKWVFLGERKQDYINHESLGQLIKDDPGLMSALTEGQPAKMMQAFGVSLSALSLQALAEDEDSRVALIKSLACLSEATGGDVEEIQNLANEIIEDPQLIEKIKQSRFDRERVAENQRIGALVEEIFKDILKDKGFVVKRTGIGSDYSIESNVIENAEEVAISIEGHSKKYLVEIKSTIADDVRMSVTQMKTAVENNENFIVCFVRLNKQFPDREVVENQSRFIFDIGDKTENLWNELSKLQTIKAGCVTKSIDDDITLEIDDLGARLKLGKELWKCGMTLDEAIEFIQNE